VSEFAERLRELREARGWTRYRLAKRAGLTNEGVIKLERPGSDPKLSTLLKLAAGLEVPPCEMLPAHGAGEGAKAEVKTKAARRGGGTPKRA
jgi:transcriptional regulator with XRE-family HTH domain